MKKFLLFTVLVLILTLSCTKEATPKQLLDSRFNGEFIFEVSFLNYMELEFDKTSKGHIMIVTDTAINSETIYVYTNLNKDKLTITIWGRRDAVLYDEVPYKFSRDGNTLEFDGMEFKKRLKD